MAYSTQRAVSNGTLGQLALALDYFDRSEISVYFNGVVSPAGSGTWSWVGTTDKTINFTPVVANGVEVMVQRSTQLAEPLHQYTKGAQFIAETLDENFKQVLRIAQEAREGSGASDVYNDIDHHGFRIKNLGPAVAPTDAISLSQYQADAAGAAQSKLAATQAATAAAASESHAATSASNANTSAGNASTSAGNASTSEANASTSATLASNWSTSLVNTFTGAGGLYGARKYANDAAASATSAATQLTNFKNIYHGAFATAPTVRPDASALVVGDLYYDTALAAMRVRQASAWASIPVALTGSSTQDFLAQYLTVSQGVVTPNVNGGPLAGFRNRLINGAMLIDFRNLASSTTLTGPANGFAADRWAVTNARTGSLSTQRTGNGQGPRPYAITITNGTGTALAAGDNVGLYQAIEAVNAGAGLGWGAAGAKPVTVSFWVTASVAGTYAVSLRNGGTTRSCVATYNVATANVDQYVSVTFPGDTAGTWNDGAVGIYLTFDLGVGGTYSTSTLGAWQAGNFFGATTGVKFSATTGATFRITEVQLEVGSVATPFEQRTHTTEQVLCRRYYQVLQPTPEYTAGATPATRYVQYFLPVQMRTTPTATLSSSTNVCWDQAGVDFTPATWAVQEARSDAISIKVDGITGKGVAGLKNFSIYLSSEF